MIYILKLYFSIKMQFLLWFMFQQDVKIYSVE